MRSRTRRATLTLALLAGGGFLMAGAGTSCSSFLGESAFVATDFCFIFDCQSGLLGGTIRPCATGSPGQGGVGDPNVTNEPLFVDCP